MATQYESFYGGRRGASYLIVNRYLTIAEMVEAFQQGGAYKAVNYDEYVIIDTVNKNDIDNGKIYRRGYDYNNDMGGAEYIGQVVGPAGMAPHVEMKTIDEVEELNKNDGLVDEEGNTYRRTSGSYAPIKNLVPGKYEEDGQVKYHDEIEYVACSVRDINSHETTVHLGFRFPYTVIDYTAKSVDPYYHRDKETEDFTNENLVDRMDDGQHPYYELWDIKIPKGIKGDTLKNLRVTTVAECNEQHPGWLQQYAGMDDDEITEAIKKERKIFVYDYYHYDKNGNGEPVSIYLGDYNKITNIDLADNGTLTIDYSHNDEQIFDRVFKWIKSVKLDTETGHFAIEFNHETDANGEPTIYETDLRWVKDIEFQEDGSVNLKYTTNTDQGLEYDRLIKWIKEVSLDPETGKFIVLFNHDESASGEPTKYEVDLRWVHEVTIDDEGTINFNYTNGEDTTYTKMIKYIKEVTLNGETGHLTVKYNHETDADGNSTQYDTDLRWVNNVEIAEDGTVTLKYTTGTDVTLENKIKWITSTVLSVDGTLTINYNDGSKDIFDKQIKWIESISFTDAGLLTIHYNNDTPDLEKEILWPTEIKINTGDKEGEGDQLVTITFNNGTVKTAGLPLNYIMQTAIDERYHLLVLYADPARRAEIKSSGKSASYDGRNDWYDLGYIGNGSGVGAIVGKEDDPIIQAIAETIPPYSAWLILEDDE